MLIYLFNIKLFSNAVSIKQAGCESVGCYGHVERVDATGGTLLLCFNRLKQWENPQLYTSTVWVTRCWRELRWTVRSVNVRLLLLTCISVVLCFFVVYFAHAEITSLKFLEIAWCDMNRKVVRFKECVALTCVISTQNMSEDKRSS